MNKPSLSLSLAATLALLGGGCAQYEAQSKTAKGAEIGAATGAVLGGVIGNNGPHGNTEKGAAIGAVAGGLAGAAIGRHQEQRDAAAAPARTADVGYTVQTVPPAPTSQPYETMPPQPSRDAVWVRGHYEYTGSGYQWVAGRWEIPPSGMRTWIEPSWQSSANGGYVYVRGHWQ